MLARMAAEYPLPSTETEDFDTANEALDSTDAYATARERGTETDDFQTGLEDFDSEETETESPSQRTGANRANALRRAPIFASSHQTYSYESTASTSGSEDDEYADQDRTITRTPTTQTQSVRNRISRGSLSRRPRQISGEHGFQSSPGSQLSGSFSSAHTLPQQSLFAELGELEGSDEDSAAYTPGRRSLRSMTPASTTRGSIISPRTGLLPPMPTKPKVVMVDSGMMTEPVEVPPSQELSISNLASQEVEPRAEAAPEPVLPPELGLSNVFSEHVEPIAEPEVSPPSLSMSHVVAEGVEPVAEPEVPAPALSVSSIFAEHVEPVTEPEKPLPELVFSSIASHDSEPIAEPEKPIPTLALSPVASVDSEPVAVPEPEPKVVTVVEYVEAPKPAPPALSYSAISASEVEPVAVPEPEPKVLRVVEYVDAPKPPPAELAFSSISSAAMEDILSV